VFATGERLLSNALSELGFGDETTWNENTKLMAINTLPWSRCEIIKLPNGAGLSMTGSEETNYALAHSNSSKKGFGALEIVPMASQITISKAFIEEIRPNVYEMRNSQFVVQVTDGAITSLYDIHTQRELIPKGAKAAQLVIFDDKPLYWQAWDVEVYHLQSRKELKPSKVTIIENSIHRVSLEIETKISDKSWIKTTMSLPAAGVTQSAIEIDAEIEWHETMKFLKVEFPVDIVNTEASYETQFGIVRRPTHYNTSWDMAKFEVCCHKWADLSEATYGVSILNDNKYGFATAGNVMRLSLLRAPKAPDAHADMGNHKTRYAIFPHEGPLDHRTIRKAFEFNNPLKVVGRQAGRQEEVLHGSLLNPFHIHNAPNLVLDTIKRGEDDEDVSRGELLVKKGHSIILRIYDALGGKSKGVLTWGDLKVKKVVKVNALEDEEDGGELAIGSLRTGAGGEEETGVEIVVRAFEVASYKLVLE
jgi:alpha-mannosidase